MYPIITLAALQRGNFSVSWFVNEEFVSLYGEESAQARGMLDVDR